MTPWQQRSTALTRRMAEDMQLRNMSQSTIDAYTYHVGRFAVFPGRSPEDVRSFQLHLIREKKVGWSSFNQAVSPAPMHSRELQHPLCSNLHSVRCHA